MIYQVYKNPDPYPCPVYKGQTYQYQSSYVAGPAQGLMRFTEKTLLNPSELSICNKLDITEAEFKRRHMIIVDLLEKCSYRIGEYLYPCRLEDYVTHGLCKVNYFIRSYSEIALKEAWPTEGTLKDNPFIVSAHSEKSKSTFNCTINYLVKTVPTI